MCGAASTPRTDPGRRASLLRRVPSLFPALSLALAAAVCALAMPAAAQPLPYQTCLAELVVNGEPLGNAEFTLSPSRKLLLPAELIHRALDGRAREAVIAALAASGQLVDEEALAEQGVFAAFDEANLVLSIVIAAEAMVPVSLGERPSPARSAGAAVQGGLRPETFAAMLDLDLRGSLGLARDDAAGAGSGAVPTYGASLDLRPSIYLAGWVAEASAGLRAGTAFEAELLAARLVRDFPSIRARATAGLAAVNGSAFGTSLEILGATFGREASMTEGAGGSGPSDEIILERPAAVLVELNGVVLRRYRLGRGSWRIADLPLAAGLNDLTIRILEDGAAPRVMRLGLPYDPSMLAPGSIDWSLASGLDRETLGLPFAAGMFMAGLAPGFQLSLRGSYGAGLLGAESSARWASALGTLDATGALSLDLAPEGRPAWAGRITWNFAVPGSRYVPALGLGAEYRAPGYLAPSAAMAGREVPGAETVTLSGQLAEALPAGLGSLAVFGSAVLKDGRFSSASAAAGLQLLAGKAAIVSIAGGADWKEGAAIEPRLSVSLASLPSGGAALQFRHDLVKRDSSFAVTVGKDPARSPVLDVRGEGFGATAGADGPDCADGSDGPSLGLSLRANLPTVGLGAGLAASTLADSSFSEADASFSASTTFAFAGGQVAFGNALGSAFAIIVPDPALGGADVELALASGGRTRTAAGRPGLVPGIAAYRPVSANVELPGSPPDARPFPASLSFIPAYRSGTVIRVGMAPSVTVMARVITPAGQPLRNMAGALEAAASGAIPEAAAGAATDGPAATEVLAAQTLVFTDEDGILAIYGIAPGSYRIRWTDGSTSTFSVATEARGAVRLGAIQAVAGGSP